VFFNRRQEPQEFRSEMPEYDEDQDEYYGEEDDGDAGDDEYDDEDDEDGDGAQPAKKGGGNAVRTALMAIAGVGVVGLGGYYAATLLAPEAMTELVNTYFGGGEQAAEAPPADPAAPPPGEAAPPPGGDTKPVDQAAAPSGAPADKPAAEATEKPAEPAAAVPPAPKPPKPKKFPVPTPDPEVLQPSKPDEVGEWVQPDTVVPAAKPKPPATNPTKSAWRIDHERKKLARARAAARARAVRAAQLARYKRQHGRGYQAHNARYTKRHARTWHARYNAPAHPRGTAWIQGQSAYIPWGGGSHAAPAHRTWAHRPAASRGRYGVQVGSFANASNAHSLVSQLRSQGIPAYVGHGVGMTRVYVGAYRNLHAAGAAVRQLQTQGIPAAVSTH
jgi:cell division septation protein DedD